MAGRLLEDLTETTAPAQADIVYIVVDPSGVPLGRKITLLNLQKASVTAGITASTTQSQGQGALTTTINEVSTVANDNDVVTLPPAAPGLQVTIINNGANNLQIFPASGDDLGAGGDTSTVLEANEVLNLTAYDATNWHFVSSTEIAHAEMHDESNTDAFTVNAQTDLHCYHTNGLTSGDLLGFTFDAGGGGTSHAISSIADGADSGVDIALTTGDAHLLAVGDIVSQTNLTSAVYTGVFVVKAIISSLIYEVAAVYTATDTGTMDQAATLDVITGEEGVYHAFWHASATSAGSNETFDFELYNTAAHVTGSYARRKFGSAGDVGAFSGGALVTVGTGDKLSFVVSNIDSAANLTIRHFNLVLVRL